MIGPLHLLGGWRLDHELIDRICADNGPEDLYAAAPHLKGVGEGVRAVLLDALRQAEGGWRPYRAQTRGTCVGRGGGRACDILQALKVAEGAQWRARISSEIIYGFARVEIGGRRIRGDGAVVANAVEAVRRLGVLPRGRYETESGPIEIPPEDDDGLAAQWGLRGVPDELEPLCLRHLVRQWAPVRNYAQARDAIAAGYVVWFGTSQAFWRSLPARRDADGFLRPVGSTAHSWLAVGADDDRSRPHLILDNRSWGDGWVTGPEGAYPIPPGCYRADAEAFDLLVRKGEAYAVGDLDGFPIKKLDYLLV
ncbi:hypothetical protein [Thermopirellula anaerolimosa]